MSYFSLCLSFPPVQAALIASAMILIQHTEGMSSRVASFRQRYSKMISDKLEDSVAKFGAIIAQGIIDAGQGEGMGKRRGRGQNYCIVAEPR